MTSRRDWFYFVDGIEGDRSAVEVKLKDGDVEWWDYRSWRGDAMSVPVVVGAYPHPFLRGTTSVTAVGVDPKIARAIATQVHGTVAAKKPSTNYIVVSRNYAPDHVQIRRFRDGALPSSAPPPPVGSPTIQLRCGAGTESRRERRARRRAPGRSRGRGPARLTGVGRRTHLRGAARRGLARRRPSGGGRT